MKLSSHEARALVAAINITRDAAPAWAKWVQEFLTGDLAERLSKHEERQRKIESRTKSRRTRGGKRNG